MLQCYLTNPCAEPKGLQPNQTQRHKPKSLITQLFDVLLALLLVGDVSSSCELVAYSYVDACRNITTQWRRATQFFRKIYLSLYLKGLCVRGSWRPNRTATYWPSFLWPWQRFFHIPQADQPGAWGPSLSGTCSSFQHYLSKWSELQLQLLNRGPEGPLCRVLVFSTASYLQLTRTSCAPNYIIVLHPLSLLLWLANGICNFRPLWNGMFDHHQTEITVMQFTGHPLPVHQYCQSRSLKQSLPITGQRNMRLPPSLEWHVWPSRRSIYNILYQNCMKQSTHNSWSCCIQWELDSEEIFLTRCTTPEYCSHIICTT